MRNLILFRFYKNQEFRFSVVDLTPELAQEEHLQINDTDWGFVGEEKQYPFGQIALSKHNSNTLFTVIDSRIAIDVERLINISVVLGGGHVRNEI